MASGDIFSETNGSIPATSFVSVRPAAGVQVVIMNTFGDSNAIFYGGSETTAMYFGDAGGHSTNWTHLGSGNVRILLTNDEYINVNNPTAGAIPYGYTGMEI
tara:strand:- start:21 stop:326 length:306 start_codon:yes stop_codon:yes gene_type:complete